ncbi:MAG: hypothetical protein JSU81_08830 [Candidatus Coatesbacteria bacterium]|nr:MAG: hypothetical protein JSU81_08830 [Candidatus Coatesbacteria bacterium]
MSTANRHTRLAVCVAIMGVWAWGSSAGAASDTILSSFASPTSFPYGLTYSSGTLYLSDAVSMTIYRLHPDTGSVMSSFVPSPKPAGSFMVGLASTPGYLWATTISPSRLFQIGATSGSVVNSYTLSSITDADGLAAEGNYVYIANSSSTAFFVYKFHPSSGSIVDSWPGGKYPSGLNVITHVPTGQKVVMNVGNVDGWVPFNGLNGQRYSGQAFKIDAPCGEGNYAGDLATRDNTHIYYAANYLKYIYYLSINWGKNEVPAVAPTSFGKIKALYR